MHKTKDNASTDSDLSIYSKIISIFSLSFAICILLFGIGHLILIYSKKMTLKLINLRKKYKQYQGFLKNQEFNYTFNQIIKTNKQ